MSLKGYNGPEDVIKLQEWLAIEKQIFIETRVCWNKEGTFPIGFLIKFLYLCVRKF